MIDPRLRRRADQREVEQRLGLGPEVVLHHVLDHADDGVPALASSRWRRRPIGSWSGHSRSAAERLRITLLDLGDGSPGVNGAAAQELDAHGAEVVAAGPGDAEERAGVRFGPAAFDPEPRALHALVERNVLDDADRLDPRQRAQAVHEVEVEARVRRSIGEVRLLGRDLEGEEVLGVVAGIDVAELLEAAHQEPRSDEEHERHRGLRHHQPVARPVPSPGGAASAVAQPRRRRARSGSPASGRRGAWREREAPSVKRSVALETVTWSRPGTLGGAARNRSGTLAHASASASAPASAATTAASVSWMRIRWPRVAPSARRTARSRWRRSKRTMNRLATLAQAMRRTMRGRRRTSPTTARTTGPRIASSSGSTIGRSCSIRRA